MKICYCIIAHKFTPVLAYLVDFITESGDIALLHVDQKSDISKFEPIFDKVIMCPKRISTEWGGISLTSTYLELLKASRTLSVDYLVFVSGDTMPIQTTSYIREYFALHKSRSLIPVRPLSSRQNLRVKYLYSFTGRLNMIGKLIHRVRLILGLYPKNRNYGSLPPLYGGSAWFGLPVQFRDYILEYVDDGRYIDAFKHSLCSDEIFFHTILANSEYSVLNDNYSIFYIDWSEGKESPKTLVNDDIEVITKEKTLNQLFARKIDDNIDLDLWHKTFNV